MAMSNATERDFGRLLDELMAAARVEEAPASIGLASVDYLAVAEELGHISITADEAQAEYLESEMLAPPVEPQIQDVVVIGVLPSIDPADIERELCIARIDVGYELDRVRRDFAFANHPDRVEPHLRPRAELRMQIANQLLDEAKQKLTGRQLVH